MPVFFFFYLTVFERFFSELRFKGLLFCPFAQGPFLAEYLRLHFSPPRISGSCIPPPCLPMKPVEFNSSSLRASR